MDRKKIAAQWQSGGSPLRRETTPEEAQKRLEFYAPKAWKKGLAAFSLVCGIIVLISPEAYISETTAEAVRAAIATPLLGLATALPGSYWLIRNHKDQRAVNQWLEQQETYDQLQAVLKLEDHHYLGIRKEAPLLPQRRWALVALITVILYAISGGLLPS